MTVKLAAIDLLARPTDELEEAIELCPGRVAFLLLSSAMQPCGYSALGRRLSDGPRQRLADMIARVGETPVVAHFYPAHPRATEAGNG